MTCTIVSDEAELLLKCKNEHEPPYPAVKEQLRDAIWELCCKGFNKFYLNCEYGIPLWTAEIICAFKMYNDIELHIVIPYALHMERRLLIKTVHIQNIQVSQ